MFSGKIFSPFREEGKSFPIKGEIKLESLAWFYSLGKKPLFFRKIKI
jgi:hypothetical protein